MHQDGRKRRAAPQPLDVINIPGALLKLETLCAIAGESKATLYRAAKAGQLQLVKNGARCTRVTTEHARSYLELRARAAAEMI